MTRITVPKISKNKYGARKISIDNTTYDSHAEFKRISELQISEKAGYIHNLVIKPRFDLCAQGGVQFCTYTPEVAYQIGGTTIVEDVKGYKIHETSVIKMACLSATNPTWRCLFVDKDGLIMREYNSGKAIRKKAL